MKCWSWILTFVAVSAATAWSMSSPAAAQEGVLGGTIVMSGQTLEFRRFLQVAGSGNEHVELTHSATAGSLCLVNQSGTISKIDTSLPGSPTSSTFLDVAAAVAANSGGQTLAGGFEGGVRSVAFHPDLENVGEAGYGKVYTSILETRPVNPALHTYIGSATYAGPGPSTAYAADSVLVEWNLNQTTGVVDPTSYREVFRIGVPVFHPMHQIGFNPNSDSTDPDYGLLYVSVGDGGPQGDEGQAAGQNGASPLGSILRIDPLQDGGASYSVPTTGPAANPFVGDASVLDEIYAQGFRNPQRFYWTSAADGGERLIVADIGYTAIEEINFVEAGKNYGWGDREGTFQVDGLGNVSPLAADDSFTYPVAQYGHASSTAVAGGFVLGSGYGDLQGDYVFSDVPSGRLFHIDFDDMLAAVTEGDHTALTQVPIEELQFVWDDDDNPATPGVAIDYSDLVNGGGRADARLGLAPDGALYLLNKTDGWIYQAVTVPEPGAVLLFLTGVFAAGMRTRWRRRND